MRDKITYSTKKYEVTVYFTKDNAIEVEVNLIPAMLFPFIIHITKGNNFEKIEFPFGQNYVGLTKDSIVEIIGRCKRILKRNINKVQEVM